MKKILLTVVSALCLFTVNAQSTGSLETYSVYDVNHDTSVSVSDVTEVVGRAKKITADDKQVVDAATLNDVLQAIAKKLEILQDIQTRLAAIEAKLGITPSEPEDPDPVDPYNGHEYVDLGLPSGLKWATCNVGAENPEDNGDYYAWGETETKSYYDWSTYKWCSDGSNAGMTKYTYPDGCVDVIWYSNGTFVGDNKTILDPEDDVAHVKWGGDWRMPTKAEQDELRDSNNCTWEWTIQGGKKGYLVTSNKNGNSIFLPATGWRYGSNLYDDVSRGYYWSSSLNLEHSGCAYYLWFRYGELDTIISDRYLGLSVRAVCP